MYEYTSEVFAVGLDGFAAVDNKKITAMAAEGWEPTHMTTVHNGFAAVVLFRREGGTARRAPARAAAGRVRKAPAKAAPARATKPKTTKAAAKAGKGTTASRSPRG